MSPAAASPTGAGTPWLWPFRGLGRFLATPRFWPAPLAATALALVATVLLAAGALWFFWPAEETGTPDLAWYHWIYYWAVWFARLIWQYALPFAAGLAALLVGWFVLLPFLAVWGMEFVVRRALQRQGLEIREEGLRAAIASALRVFVTSLGWQALWLTAGLLLTFVAIGPFVALWGLGHITGLEALDLALSLRGLPGRRRSAILGGRRGQVLAFGFGAGLLCFLLQLTVIGVLLWLPAIFLGAALWAATWPEMREGGEA